MKSVQKSGLVLIIGLLFNTTNTKREFKTTH